MRRTLVPGLLLSTLFLPFAAVATQPQADASPITGNLRVSTGVIAPTIVSAVQITMPEGVAPAAVPAGAQVGLLLTVDRNGQPQNIRVVRSLNPAWDASVVSAVRQFRFHPGSIDNQPIAMDLNLTVNITN